MNVKNQPVFSGGFKARKRGRPRKWVDGVSVPISIAFPIALRQYVEAESKTAHIPMSDIIIMAVELMKNNGVIIERKIIRGDCAADPPTSGE